MAQRAKKRKTGVLPVIWTVTDDLWPLIEPVLLEDAPPCSTGRPRADWRRILDGIIYRLRTGCQGNKLPVEFGDDKRKSGVTTDREPGLPPCRAGSRFVSGSFRQAEFVANPCRACHVPI